MRSMECIKRADRIADRLVSKLNAPECRPFFCKCAYALSENDIEILLERAMKSGIEVPKRYFTHSAKALMSRNRS